MFILVLYIIYNNKFRSKPFHIYQFDPYYFIENKLKFFETNKVKESKKSYNFF